MRVNQMWIVALLAMLLAGCSGCKSPEASAYKTVATITTTVDSAMNGWGDYVRAGKATQDEQDKVRDAYGKYQRAMLVAEAAVEAIKAAPETEKTYVKVIQAVTASADELLALVAEFQRKEVK